MSNKANEVMEAVTERLIASLEAGAVSGEWNRPWIGGEIAMNAVTGNQYSGGNLIVLWVLGEDFGSQYYATYKQWQSVGAQVRKGESGITLVKWTPIECKDHGKDEMCMNCGRAIPKAFTVFNSTQVDGWDGETQNEDVRRCDLDHYFGSVGATIKHGANASYNKRTDEVTVPHFEAFESAEAYYATLGHEMIHWTGHADRLNRQYGEKFGDDAYAFEELVAELGSAMLCASLGITDTPRPDHARYLKHWVHVLKQNYRVLWTAASAAQKAVTFIMSHAEIKEGVPA